MFLAWRSLYAELTRARIDKGTPEPPTGCITKDRNHARNHDDHPTDCVRSVLEEMVETANMDK